MLNFVKKEKNNTKRCHKGKGGLYSDLSLDTPVCFPATKHNDAGYSGGICMLSPQLLHALRHVHVYMYVHIQYVDSFPLKLLFVAASLCKHLKQMSKNVICIWFVELKP